MAKIKVDYVPEMKSEQKANISINNRGVNYCSVNVGGNIPAKPEQPENQGFKEKVDPFVSGCDLKNVRFNIMKQGFNHIINRKDKGE